MSAPMLHETIWFDKRKYDEAEELYQAHLNGITNCPCPATKTTKPDAKTPTASPDKQTTMTQASCSSSIKEIAEARRKIQQTLSAAPASSSPSVQTGTDKRISELEEENHDLRKKMNELTAALKKIELRVTRIESSDSIASPAPVVQEEKEETKKDDDDDSDSDVDLFGSSSEEEESEESKRVKEERIAAYEAKKSKKPAVNAKSSILLDVKPWSDETDLVALEKKIRGIETDGLLWGVSKFVPIAYGVSKIQICCVVEDDKVGSEFLEEEITGRFMDDVQSVDIAAFNKI